ncbi:MAG: tetratricopeptide repeat protein [Candidatus Marinimicrobia bacterium]|nr:tetratricopeptide repeat protein [Candidatus Neomarinimicrobiota bacterium]
MAGKAFKLNSKEYPKSGNVWDSLAEGYMKTGDNKKAKKYYRKSLKLTPNNQNAKDMLKKLKEKE